MAAIVTGRPKADLSKDLELFISRIKAAPVYRDILRVYVPYAHDYRHGSTPKSPRYPLTYRDAEGFVYLTGIFLRSVSAQES